jgi:hypothetical protein
MAVFLLKPDKTKEKNRSGERRECAGKISCKIKHLKKIFRDFFMLMGIMMDFGVQVLIPIALNV